MISVVLYHRTQSCFRKQRKQNIRDYLISKCSSKVRYHFDFLMIPAMRAWNILYTRTHILQHNAALRITRNCTPRSHLKSEYNSIRVPFYRSIGVSVVQIGKYMFLGSDHICDAVRGHFMDILSLMIKRFSWPNNSEWAARIKFGNVKDVTCKYQWIRKASRGDWLRPALSFSFSL